MGTPKECTHAVFRGCLCAPHYGPPHWVTPVPFLFENASVGAWYDAREVMLMPRIGTLIVFWGPAVPQ